MVGWNNHYFCPHQCLLWTYIKIISQHKMCKTCSYCKQYLLIVLVWVIKKEDSLVKIIFNSNNFLRESNLKNQKKVKKIKRENGQLFKRKNKKATITISLMVTLMKLSKKKHQKRKKVKKRKKMKTLGNFFFKTHNENQQNNNNNRL